ncbi:MAG: cation diffusion facilitator family transporter [Nitrospinota bacterium]
MEILVALLNAALLIVVSFFLFKEALIRLFNPVFINSKWVMLIASFGLVANAACAVLLKSHSHNNMNIRSAFVHLVSDALVSLVVIIGAVFIYYFEFFWIDSLLVFVIGLYVIKEGYTIVLEALAILMQYVPRGIDIEEIQRDIESIDGIKNIHHVHVWGLTERDIHLEAHIEVDDEMKVADTCPIKNMIEEYLLKKYHIGHVTLQFECEACPHPTLINNEEGGM